MTKEDSRYDFNSMDIIVYLWKKRIPLIIITLAGAILSTLVSFTITPKFKGTVVLFPASETPVSKALFMPGFYDRVGLLGFGDEFQLERMLQVLQSGVVRSRIINKYNLKEHYEIDSDSPYALARLYAEFESNVDVNRTEYNSIVVEVMDTDPQMAADIANDMAAFADTALNQMKYERAMKALAVVEEAYEQKSMQVQSYKDSIAALSQAGLFVYETQAERLTEAYAKAKVEGNVSGAEMLQNDFDVVQKYSDEFLYYRTMLSHESLKLSDLQGSLLEARTEADQLLSHVFILDKAYKADKKAYPRKSLIVMASTFATFLLAVILFLFFDSFLRKLRSAS